MSDNRRAFLDMLAWAEIGPGLLAISDDGYDVLVGSTPERPLLFDSYATHPRVYNEATNSTAAGRYQLLARYFDFYAKQLCLGDFGHDSQDAIAVQQIRERSALPLIDGGSIVMAIYRCSNIWASIPGPGNVYGQPKHTTDALLAAFRQAGGIVA